MLTVALSSSQEQLNISAAYLYAKRIRTIPTAEFDRELKVWQIQRNMVSCLLEQFKGELYFKTPLWVIEDKPMPDMTEQYQVPEDIRIPELKIPLYDYQKFGARFMVDRMQKHNFVINADGCGIGKTGQAIAVMQWYKEHKHANKFLIVAKKAIKTQWADEIQKFSCLGDTYKILYTADTKKKREKIYQQANDEKNVILITNYHNFLNDVELIDHVNFDMVVVDEAHCVKAREGVLNKNIGQVVAHRPTVFLTGTPVMSRPEDIFGIVQMSQPEYFGDWDAFEEHFLVSEYHYGYKAIVGAKNLDELRTKVQDAVIRRTEFEISIQMPDTVEKNIYVEKDKMQTDLSDIIRKQEESMQNAFKQATEDIKKVSTEDERERLKKIVEISAIKLKAMISLKQASATDPRLFLFATSKTMQHYAEYVPTTYKGSPKTEAILDLISEILDEGDKVILFSKFVTIGTFFAAEITAKLKQNVLMYTGNENTKKRAENINLFRDSDIYNILIGSDAMAEGLNLAEARHVINLDLPDTYAIYQQRIGRVRRVSSLYGNVIVHNCLTKESVDEQKLEKLKKDKDLDGALVACDVAQAEAVKKLSVG